MKSTTTVAATTTTGPVTVETARERAITPI
jgi:hypothetical protein